MTRDRADAVDLDTLIDEITVDCYGEDEALTGFDNAFDEGTSLPCCGTVIGEPVNVMSIGLRDGRRELVATCDRDGIRYDVALLDLSIDADPTLARLIAAYRRWLGVQDPIG